MYGSETVILAAATRPHSATATCPIPAVDWRAAPAAAHAPRPSSAPRRQGGLLGLNDSLDPKLSLPRAESDVPHLVDACPIAPCDWRNSPPPTGAAASFGAAAGAAAGSGAASGFARPYAASSSLPGSPDRTGWEGGSPDVFPRPAGLRRSLLEQRSASYNEGEDSKPVRRDLPGIPSPLAASLRSSRSSSSNNSENSGGSGNIYVENRCNLRGEPVRPAAVPSCDAAGKQSSLSRVAVGTEVLSAWWSSSASSSSSSSASSSSSVRSGLGVDGSSGRWSGERGAAAATAAVGHKDADFNDDCTIGHSMAEEVGSVEAECVNWDEVESLCQSMDVAGVQLEDVFILTPSSPPSSPSPSPSPPSSSAADMPSRTTAAAGLQQKHNIAAEAVTAHVLYALKFRNMTLLHYPGDHATKQLFHQVYISH